MKPGILNTITRFTLVALCMGLFLPITIHAQYDQWTAPTAQAGYGITPPPLNTGVTPQIKNAPIGIDLDSSLNSLPFGAGFFARAGSVFIELTGAGVLANWVPAIAYAIDTNAPIRAHGFNSTADITALKFKTGSAGEARICADPATGILQLCTDATLTVSAQGSPFTYGNTYTTTISVSGKNISSCAGTSLTDPTFNWTTNVLTGNNNSPTYYSKYKYIHSNYIDQTYTLTCTASTGAVLTKAVTVTPAVDPVIMMPNQVSLRSTSSSAPAFDYQVQWTSNPDSTTGMSMDNFVTWINNPGSGANPPTVYRWTGPGTSGLKGPVFGQNTFSVMTLESGKSNSRIKNFTFNLAP